MRSKYRSEEIMELECEAMLGRLGRIREDIAKAQDSKIIELWDEKGDYQYAPLSTLVDKLKEECWELYKALREEGPESIRDEIVDVRNVTEFLWDILKLSRDSDERRPS